MTPLKELWTSKELNFWQKIVGTLLLWIAKGNEEEMKKDDGTKYSEESE